MLKILGDIETGKKLWCFNDKNYQQILCITVSSDGKYLAYAGIHPKHEITIHDPENNKRLDAFKGHRDTVSVCINQCHFLTFSVLLSELELLNCFQDLLIEL